MRGHEEQSAELELARRGGVALRKQLARNMFTSGKKNFSRKIFETFAALQLEQILSKDEILCSYLNVIYMGEGADWRTASQLVLLQQGSASFVCGRGSLAGWIVVPAHRRILRCVNLDFALQRQREVLGDLLELGDLSEEELHTSLSMSFCKCWYWEDDAGTLGDHFSNNNIRNNFAPTVNALMCMILF